MSRINEFHVAMVGPILYYIGNSKKEGKIYAYIALATLALSIIFFVRRSFDLNYHGIVRLMHYLIYVPLLLYISYKNTDLPDWAFTLIKYIGISVSSIHFYLLYKKNLNNLTK